MQAENFGSCIFLVELTHSCVWVPNALDPGMFNSPASSPSVDTAPWFIAGNLPLCAALSTDWIHLSKRWMPVLPKWPAHSNAESHMRRALHQLHCTYDAQAVYNCAVCLTQLGCVRFSLYIYISCAPTITEPNAFGPAGVGRYIYVLLGLRGLWHCFLPWPFCSSWLSSPVSIFISD